MKTYFFKGVIILSLIFSISSCDEILDTLTEAEVAEGLKSALTVATDTSVSIVSAIDGYYKDEAIKILLPPEAQIIYDYKDEAILQAIGISDLIEDFVLKMNRAAEDAAKSAAPIFVNAITGITIVDAFEILNGEDTAATHYLKENTYSELQSEFQPTIKQSLDKPLVGDVSANESWEYMTTQYNTVAESFAGILLGLTPVNTELDEHVTQKGLNGLFSKVAEEEKDIRHDPLARVNSILEDVFGSLDK